MSLIPIPTRPPIDEPEPLVIVKENTAFPCGEVPFEFEFRVHSGHLELWRFWEYWNERKTSRSRLMGRAKMRKGGRKLPKTSKKLLGKKPCFAYLSAFAKVKAQWKSAGRPPAWACRFDGFEIVEVGLLVTRKPQPNSEPEKQPIL